MVRENKGTQGDFLWLLMMSKKGMNKNNSVKFLWVGRKTAHQAKKCVALKTLSKMFLKKINTSDMLRATVATYRWIYPRHKYCISQPSWDGTGRGHPHLYSQHSWAGSSCASVTSLLLKGSSVGMPADAVAVTKLGWAAALQPGLETAITSFLESRRFTDHFHWIYPTNRFPLLLWSCPITTKSALYSPMGQLFLYTVPRRMGFNCKYGIWEMAGLLILSRKDSSSDSSLCWFVQHLN